MSMIIFVDASCKHYWWFVYQRLLANADESSVFIDVYLVNVNKNIFINVYQINIDETINFTDICMKKMSVKTTFLVVIGSFTCTCLILYIGWQTLYELHMEQ